MQLGHDQINDLILRTLVRKLVEKNLLTHHDVQAILTEAAHGLNVLGSPMTDEAVSVTVESDLMPAFLGAGPPEP